MNICFEEYDDEKLRDWIWTFNKIPMVKLLYDKDGLTLYQEACHEMVNRGLSIN